MSVLLWVLGSTVLISLISFVGVATLSLKREFLKKILLIFVAFAAGALIGVSIFDLIPEALEMGQNSAGIYIVSGILLFFGVERFIGWHHMHHEADIDPASHKEHHHNHEKPFVWINLIAESIHNFIDGTLIAASFLVNVPLGITTTIAVAMHEIPQEIGDFAILVHGGLKIKTALVYNFLVAITAVLGGILTIYLSGVVSNLTPALLGIAGGGFLYLALTDLLPEIHKEKSWKKSSVEFVFLIIGLLVVYWVGIALPD